MIGIPMEDVELPIQRIVLDEPDFVGVRANAGEMADIVPLIADGRIRAGDLKPIALASGNSRRRMRPSPPGWVRHSR